MNSNLSWPLGKDESGKHLLADLTQTGNIIMGGTTGSGKSVFNHNLIYSLVSKYNPSSLKLFLADPKRVEFLGYDKIPHILGKVCIEPEDIINQLTSLKEEIANKQYPYLVIVIDTFSDVMAQETERFESIISDLSKLNDQGVYIILCDSRVGPEVFSSKIMDCFPTRIAFNTFDEEGSILLIGQSGAEKLTGKGDMLFLQRGEDNPIRLQGTYISEEDIEKIVEGQGLIKS